MKRTIPFLIKDGVSVGETWITSEVVLFVMRSHGKRMQALPTARTASAMVFWSRGRSAGRTETGTLVFGQDGLLPSNYFQGRCVAGWPSPDGHYIGDSSLQHSLGADGGESRQWGGS